MTEAPYDAELDQALAALEQMGDAEDPLSLLQPLFEADALADLETRPEAELPGKTPTLEIPLAEEQKRVLAFELCDLLNEIDGSMIDRNEREEEIRDAYAMIPDPTRGGRGPGAAEMVSEMLMSGVDQAAARVFTAISGVQPLIRVDPIKRAGFDGEQAKKAADDAEKFLQAYVLTGPPDFQYTLPVAILRTCMVGTSVLYLEWADEERVVTTYIEGERDPVEQIQKEGKLNVFLVDNRDVKIWPPTVTNWQKATFIGHETRHTPESWRALAKLYNLPEDLRKTIEGSPSERDEAAEAEMRRSGIEPSALFDRKELQPYAITQLYCNMVLPGEDRATRFQVILHRPTQSLLYIGRNPYFKPKFPYFPLRYKWSDGSAWGTGVGHEGLPAQSADSAMWCIELDSLFAGCYWLTLRKAGSVYNTQSEDLHPGAEIVVDDVNEDFKPIKLGGEVPELHTSRNNNYSRFRTASGLSSVSSGQGDPVMKSGAGTGSVLALIEQGDKKLKMVDSNLRTDLSAPYMFILELVAQYAPDGLFYQWVDEEEAESLRLLKYVPQRGEMEQMFRLRAQAPSVGSSDESRKQNIMMIGNLAQQHIGIIDAMVTEQLTQDNPAAIPRWKAEVISYLTAIHLQTVKLHELPGIPELVPKMPEMTPQDETINQLQEFIAQLQQQLQQLAQQGQETMGAQPQPEQPMGGEMPPEGMPGTGMGQMGMGEMLPQMGNPMMGGGNGMVA